MLPIEGSRIANNLGKGRGGGDDSSLFYFYSNDAAMSCEMLRCVGKLISETLTN